MIRLAPRWPETGVQAVLAALAVYGVVSIAGLAARWGIAPLAPVAILAWLGLAALGLPLVRGEASWRHWAVLAAAAIMLRGAAALLTAGRESSGDPHSYLILAQGLLATHRLGIWEPWFGGYWRALFPPLYPLVLAGWGAIAGFSTPSLLLSNAIVDLAAAGLLWRLGTRLGQRGAGRLAAWLYLIWPSTLLSAALAQKESLCALLVLALALAWHGAGAARWHSAAAIGALAALLALTQPGEAPIAALFGLAAIARIGAWRMLLTGLRALPVALLVMLPWWVRNALVLGAFVPLTSASGPSLWIGNNPDATGNWEPPPPALRGVPELAYGKRIAALAIDWMRTHPGGVVRLTLAKLLRAGGVGEFGVVRLAAMTPPITAGIAAALWPLTHGAHIALLALAAKAARARPSPGLVLLVLLVAACIAQWLLFGMWFEFGERHREFATPFLLLLACWPLGEVGKSAPTA